MLRVLKNSVELGWLLGLSFSLLLWQKGELRIISTLGFPDFWRTVPRNEGSERCHCQMGDCDAGSRNGAATDVIRSSVLDHPYLCSAQSDCPSGAEIAPQPYKS